MEPLRCGMSGVGIGLAKGAVVENKALEERPFTGFRVASRLDSTTGLVDDGGKECLVGGGAIELSIFGDDS